MLSRSDTGLRTDGRRRTTPVGVTIEHTTESAGSAAWFRSRLEDALDRRRGMLLFRGDHRAVGYLDPPVEIVVRDGRVIINALNDRGRVLLPALRRAVAGVLVAETETTTGFAGMVPVDTDIFSEEDRTRHAGVFAAIRALVAALASPDDDLLGLYGAFGYDLIYQVESIPLRQRRAPDDRDLVLHLPDEVLCFDFRTDEAIRHRYEFAVDGSTTTGLSRATPEKQFTPGEAAAARDHAPGEYADVVREAMPLFESGNLYEVVPGQVFRRGCARSPAVVFRALRRHNPSPHSLLMNLGEGEYLVGASPEMFVRVRRDDARLLVESAPISGTIARGRDALEEAQRIRELLTSEKDESELTMCTDVDRNDKARVCVPGSVRVTSRRRIEMYSALIHTVDHVEGVLRPDRDGLDGFLAHLWAVTVTGAPKLAAVEFIERRERSPRRWYGGAVGRIGFDGTLDTVLTLRTIEIRDGVATVRAGATLLHDSDPAAEEAETELKAKALLEVLDSPARRAPDPVAVSPVGAGLSILMVDHRDSFVHCLADYLRQTGARVTTYRAGSHLPVLAVQRPDLVVLSPGPGRPAEFGLTTTLAEAERLGIPVFGVCLGLQGIVEYFGGRLNVLKRPEHGKSSTVRTVEPDSALLAGLGPTFEVGRYHSLHADAAAVPPELRVTAQTTDGIVMAVEHRTKPFAAVQFHPESIMTAGGRAGHRVIENAVSSLTRRVGR